MALIKDIENFNIQRDDLIKDIQQKIFNLSDNGSIQRLPGNPNCYIVSFTVLRNKNWSPEYNDFKHQHRLIAGFFDQYGFNASIHKIKEIIANGRLRIENNMWHFHPQIREQLKGLLYEDNS